MSLKGEVKINVDTHFSDPFIDEEVDEVEVFDENTDTGQDEEVSDVEEQFNSKVRSSSIVSKDETVWKQQSLSNTVSTRLPIFLDYYTV